jgi:uncharacterized protein (DUF1697 family)
MADLRQHLTDLGMGDPRTLLQSGNLVFQSPAGTEAELEALLEAETDRRLGLRTDFLVRGAREWASVIAKNPFPEEADGDPSHLCVVFLKSAPGDEMVRSLVAAVPGPERISAFGRHLFAYYPEGIAGSRLTISLIERRLLIRSTARNWNTVLKLAELARL